VFAKVTSIICMSKATHHAVARWRVYMVSKDAMLYNYVASTPICHWNLQISY